MVVYPGLTRSSGPPTSSSTPWTNRAKRWIGPNGVIGPEGSSEEIYTYIQPFIHRMFFFVPFRRLRTSAHLVLLGHIQERRALCLMAFGGSGAGKTHTLERVVSDVISDLLKVREHILQAAKTDKPVRVDVEMTVLEYVAALEPVALQKRVKVTSRPTRSGHSWRD